MAVCIRLKRMGRRNRPYWRICATDKRTARDGRVIEQLGHYDPLAKNDEAVKFDRQRVCHWLAAGAKPSQTVKNLLRHCGLDEKGNEVAPRPWRKKKQAPPPPAAKRVAEAKEQAQTESAQPEPAPAAPEVAPPAPPAKTDAETDAADQPTDTKPDADQPAAEAPKADAPDESTPNDAQNNPAEDPQEKDSV